MSRRPHDWSPLTGSDPVPGDPDEVARVGGRYRDTASALEQQAARLRALSSDRSWDSDAGEQWRHQAREVAGKLAKAVDRYEAAGNALRSYSGSLRSAQATADAALALAQDAERRERSTRAALEAVARAHANAEPGTPAPDTSHLQRQLELAAQDDGTARTKLGEAVRTRDAAASTATSAIDDIAGSDGLDDGRFAGARTWVGDRVEWVDRNLAKITQIAGDIALWVGLAALAVGWIPVIGQLAGAVLLAVATVFAVIALAGSLVMALQGRGSWLDVGMNLFGVLTLGVGRAALGGVKVATRGARAAGQAGRTDELVAAAVRAHPGAGRVGGKALRKMERAARKQAKLEAGPSALHRDQVTEALARGPRGVPSAGDVVRGLDPRAMARETVDGARGLVDGQNWQAARQALGNRQLVSPLLDDAARAELDALRHLGPDAQTYPGVAEYLAANSSQFVTLGGATILPLVGSGLDKADLLDDLKFHTVTPPR